MTCLTAAHETAPHRDQLHTLEPLYPLHAFRLNARQILSKYVFESATIGDSKSECINLSSLSSKICYVSVATNNANWGWNEHRSTITLNFSRHIPSKALKKWHRNRKPFALINLQDIQSNKFARIEVLPIHLMKSSDDSWWSCHGNKASNNKWSIRNNGNSSNKKSVFLVELARRRNGKSWNVLSKLGVLALMASEWVEPLGCRTECPSMTFGWLMSN